MMADMIQIDCAGPVLNSVDHAARLNADTVNQTIAADNDGVSAVQARSSEDFRELHSLYSRRLYRTILAITKNPQDAEDVLQNTFLRAYLAIHTFEGRSNIYSWLTRIAVNSALMLLRKRRARDEILFDPQPDPQLESLSFEAKDSAPNPEEAYDLDQRRRKTLRAIRRLDPQLRAPIWMQSIHGRSVNEIGRAMNISEAAVKARLYRARKRLLAIHDYNRSVRSSKEAIARACGKLRDNP
jgi:RNA polymerase sigma-70 factor (ECF subfamily)